MARNVSSSSRVKRKDVDVDEADKISKFPDDILCHILSFVPTSRDAIRTSILSRRWRYVWTSVPCIVLDNLDGDDSDLRPFADFVDRVLHLNKLSFLRKFSLRCSCNNADCLHSSRVKRWISNAILRRGGIEEFHLSLCLHDEFLPSSIFTSEKLVILKLECWGALHDVPKLSVYLPSVKIIHLKDVQLPNNDSMTYLLDGCPVIEELDINCGFHMLIIRSSSLKSLTVCNFYPNIDEIDFGIVIDTPNLERLRLWDELSEKFDVNYLCSLVEVKLRLNYRSPGSVEDDVYGNILLELLGKMSNAKYMTLSGDAYSLGQPARLDTPLTFHNLIYLELDGEDDEEDGSWQVLPFLLERAPNLISLSGLFYNLPFRRPLCLMLNLEEIHFISFQGCPNEMRWVRYFLKEAPVLEKISMRSRSKDESKILKKLSTLRRRSITYLIEFHSGLDEDIHEVKVKR